ncbi:hypothetical protein ABPG75_006595 [Micractinium tetrahymenae]
MLRLLGLPDPQRAQQPRCAAAVAPTASARVRLPGNGTCELWRRADICPGLCLARPWCWYFLTGQGQDWLAFTCGGRRRLGTCLLLDAGAQLERITRQPGFALGFKRVLPRSPDAPPPALNPPPKPT